MKPGVKKGTPSPNKGTGQRRKALCVRLPLHVVAALEEAAKLGYRSCNAEILMRLERTLWDEHGRIIGPLPDSANEKRGGGQQ